MDFKEYQEKRDGLIADAQTLIDSGNLSEDYQSKKREIEDLDINYEAAIKEQANLEAMKDNHNIANIYTAAIKEAELHTKEVMGAVENEKPQESEEYRKAFMNYVLRGTTIPEKFKNIDEITKTPNVGELIPTTVMQKIIEKMYATGMIWSRVTKTAFKGGVKIPISNVKPVATWVAEGAGSDKQKKTIDDYVIFSYHKLKCTVAVSLEVDTMALPIFESKLIENVSEAMIRAIEQAIIDGAGTGGPKGITVYTPKPGQALSVMEADGIKWKDLCAAEAALPQEYEAGAVWLMTKQTFMQLYAMTDANGQPLGRINYGIGGKPERILLGREVIVNPYMQNFNGTVAKDTLCLMLFNLSDYALNTNLNMSLKKYEDNVTDDQITKSVMLVDGKVTDVNSLVTVTVKNL